MASTSPLQAMMEPYRCGMLPPGKTPSSTIAIPIGVKPLLVPPNGRRIASASQDKTVQVWGDVNGQNVFIYHGHARGVKSLAWSGSGKYIASGSHDRTVQVWGVVTG